jgi:hypothetical protein
MIETTRMTISIKSRSLSPNDLSDSTIPQIYIKKLNKKGKKFSNSTHEVCFLCKIKDGNIIRAHKKDKWASNLHWNGQVCLYFDRKNDKFFER